MDHREQHKVDQDAPMPEDQQQPDGAEQDEVASALGEESPGEENPMEEISVEEPRETEENPSQEQPAEEQEEEQLAIGPEPVIPTDVSSNGETEPATEAAAQTFDESVAEAEPELPAIEPESAEAVAEEQPESVGETEAEPAAEVEQPVSEPEDSTEPDVQEVTASGASQEVEVEPALAAAVEEALEGAEAAEEDEIFEFLPGEWYVVHTYAGYENKVKADLETRVASMNMEEAIYEVVIPMEEVVEVKGGKKQTVQRKVFPGYLLVRMELNDDSWYVVRNTPGVTGFVGSGTKPIPLSEREVDKILKRKGEAEKPRPKAEWQMNDPVRVTTGPFANFQGVISEVDDERQKVKVLVNIFGRETPVELSFDQIAKV
jgi:transcription termination/antitermination protein NusG